MPTTLKPEQELNVPIQLLATVLVSVLPNELGGDEVSPLSSGRCACCHLAVDDWFLPKTGF